MRSSSALPVAVVAARAATPADEPPGAQEPDFQDRAGALRDLHAALWAATPADLPPLGPRVGLRRHFANARAARRLIGELAVELERAPADERERRGRGGAGARGLGGVAGRGHGR